jgi:hypothetical protein
MNSSKKNNAKMKTKKYFLIYLDQCFNELFQNTIQ